MPDPTPDASATPPAALPSPGPSPPATDDRPVIASSPTDVVSTNAAKSNQPNPTDPPEQRFRQFYQGAYLAYRTRDNAAALAQLDQADGVAFNAQSQSDAYNLRGLVLSRQCDFPEAEKMFQRAIQTDPGLWAARFNYAMVPFGYRNFTAARARFEDLSGQTDPRKQPAEAELSRFEIFLTLLVEGKPEAARAFMGHLPFGGATPARYFCEAALDFYAGDVEGARGWVDAARRAYPESKGLSFLEACRALGWLPSATPPPAIAASGQAVPTPRTD